MEEDNLDKYYNKWGWLNTLLVLSDEKIYNKHIIEAMPILEILNWLSMINEKNNLSK